MSDHTCHATSCPVEVPPKMLMCKKHWGMVPKPIRNQVWATYQFGQENGTGPIPSAAWHRAADRAICAVADQEGHIHKHLETPNLGIPLSRKW
jgi:hypothetical protein